MMVILQTAMMLLIEKVIVIGELSQTQSAMLPFWASFLLGVGMMLFAILWQMIYLGFLKTAAVSGDDPQHPMQLLRWGRPYFWRILFFQILLGFAVYIINSILVSLLLAIFWQGESLQQIPAWALQACGLTGIFILLKPTLLVPAVILVYDLTAIEAFIRMRQFQLFGMDSVWKVILAGFGLITATALMTGLAQAETTLYHIITALHHMVFSTVFLVLTLMTVLWTQRRYEAEYAEINKVDE